MPRQRIKSNSLMVCNVEYSCQGVSIKNLYKGIIAIAENKVLSTIIFTGKDKYTRLGAEKKYLAPLFQRTEHFAIS